MTKDGEKKCCDNCKFFWPSAFIIGCGSCRSSDSNFRYDTVNDEFLCPEWAQRTKKGSVTDATGKTT